MHRHRRSAPAALIFLWLLFALAGLLFSVSAGALSETFDCSVSQIFSEYPLASPDAVISSEIPPDKTDAAMLDAVGRCVLAAAADITAEGRRMLLIGLPADCFSEAFSVGHGEEPSGCTCAVLPLGESFPAVGETLPISDTLLPDGMLTVTGIAENTLSRFPEYAAEYDCFLYTDLAAWNREAAEGNARLLVLYESAWRDDPQKADAHLASLADDSAAERVFRYRDALERVRKDAEQEAELYAEELRGQEEQLSVLDTSLAALGEQIAAAEDALLSADAALERARQEFVSEMEYEEYFSANQTQMIEKQKKAEKKFSEMQADIDEKISALSELYRTRAEKEDEYDAISKKITGLSDALREMQSVPEIPAVSEEDAAWKFSFGDRSPLREALSAERAGKLRFFSCAGILFSDIAVLLCFCLGFLYTRKKNVLSLLPAVLFLICAVSGVIAGRYLLAAFLYPRLFSVPLPEGGIRLQWGKLLCFGAFPFLSFPAAALGALLRRKNIRHKRKDDNT